MRGRLQVWADPYIEVGARWERRIDGALARARVGVLLTSSSFLASEFIYRVELPALVAAAEAGDLALFCIPVSTASDDLLGDLLRYQWPRPPGQPLDLLDEPTRNQAMVGLVKELVALFGAPAAGGGHVGEGAPVEASPSSRCARSNTPGRPRCTACPSCRRTSCHAPPRSTSCGPRSSTAASNASA
jgi:hypothetical protein